MADFLIVLDYDGVIADSFDYCLSRSKEVCRQFHHKRLPEKEDWEALDDVTWEGIGRQVGIPESELADFKLAAYGRLEENAGEIPVFSGMTKAIQKLSKVFAVAVITTNSSTIVETVIAREKISESIDVIAGADIPGTKAEKIIRTMRKLNIAANRTVMVGDTVSDIRQAHLAGVKIVAVTWGWQPRAFLEKESPDFFVHSPKELVEFFRRYPERGNRLRTTCFYK